MENKVKTNKAARITALVLVLEVIFLAMMAVFGGCDTYGAAFLTSDFFKQTKADNFAAQIGHCEKNKTVFFGDSITEMFDLNNYFGDTTIYNRGISGDTTSGMLARLQTNVVDLAPDKVFFLGGANDLNSSTSIETIADNIENILTTIQTKLPNAKIVTQTVYPFNNDYKFYGIFNAVENRKNEDVLRLNSLIKDICARLNITLVDTYSYMQKDGVLNKDYALDGLHINKKGYDLIASLLKDYVTL